MDNNYLKIIIETFKSIQPITEPNFFQKKQEFKKKILGIYTKKVENGENISEEGFIDNCANAVKELKGFVVEYTKLIKDKKLSSLILAINFATRDEYLIDYGEIQLNRKNEIKSKKDQINKSFGRDYLIDVTHLVNIEGSKLCFNDIDFIESGLKLIDMQDSQQTESKLLDLSDTNAVQKLIYLNELGIIDFLRTKNEFLGSVNLMATILSSVTGVKAATLQTSLNRLINNDTDDKNHPYATKNTVNKVRQTLINKNITIKTS